MDSLLRQPAKKACFATASRAWSDPMRRRTVYLIAGSSLALLGLIAFLNWYFTPSLSIETPTEGAALCEPIAVRASWTGRLMSMQATLNGTDVKNVPLTLDNGAKTATATTEADAGTRILTVVGEFQPRFVSGLLSATQTITATRTFTVKRPDLTFAPTSVTVSQPGTQQATISRACMSAARPLAVSLATSRALIATPAQTTVTVPAQQPSAPVIVTAGTRPGRAEISPSFRHHQAAFTGTTRLEARVKRATGAFARVNPSFVTPNAKQDSPNGEFSVHVGSAIVNPGVPPPYASFDAQFKKGTTSSSPNLAGEIRFSTAALGGGAGFCAASAVGVVFSGYPQGHVSDYLYSLVDLRADSPVVREFEAESVTAHATTGAPFFYRPTLMLSPDCSLALVAGAHPNSTQEPHWLHVADVITGAGISACEIAFGGPDDGSGLTARVVDKPNAVQDVEVLLAGSVIGSCRIP